MTWTYTSRPANTMSRARVIASNLFWRLAGSIGFLRGCCLGAVSGQELDGRVTLGDVVFDALGEVVRIRDDEVRGVVVFEVPADVVRDDEVRGVVVFDVPADVVRDDEVRGDAVFDVPADVVRDDEVRGDAVFDVLVVLDGVLARRLMVTNPPSPHRVLHRLPGAGTREIP
jgi:hypothetical protein